MVTCWGQRSFRSNSKIWKLKTYVIWKTTKKFQQEQTSNFELPIFPTFPKPEKPIFINWIWDEFGHLNYSKIIKNNWEITIPYETSRKWFKNSILVCESILVQPQLQRNNKNMKVHQLKEIKQILSKFSCPKFIVSNRKFRLYTNLHVKRLVMCLRSSFDYFRVKRKTGWMIFII